MSLLNQTINGKFKRHGLMTRQLIVFQDVAKLT